jgi:hypothetical protein
VNPNQPMAVRSNATGSNRNSTIRCCKLLGRSISTSFHRVAGVTPRRFHYSESWANVRARRAGTASSCPRHGGTAAAGKSREDTRMGEGLWLLRKRELGPRSPHSSSFTRRRGSRFVEITGSLQLATPAPGFAGVTFGGSVQCVLKAGVQAPIVSRAASPQTLPPYPVHCRL